MQKLNGKLFKPSPECLLQSIKGTYGVYKHDKDKKNQHTQEVATYVPSP